MSKSADTDNIDSHAVNATRSEENTVVVVLAGLAVVIATLLSLHLIYLHLKYMARPQQQRKIIGILWFVPIYASISWFSLKFKDAAIYLDLIRDCYEGFVIWLFFSLLVSYLGNGVESRVIDIIESIGFPIQHPFPFNYFRKPIPPDSRFLRLCKQGTTQFMVIKPLCSIIAIIAHSLGFYGEGRFSWNLLYPYVTLVVNVSISWAFYSLLLFYVALKDHLAPFQPILKFVAVKSVIFISFWQGLAFMILARLHLLDGNGDDPQSVVETSTYLQNTFLCFEMLLAAILHIYAFPVTPYKGIAPTNMFLFENLFPLRDAAKDLNDADIVDLRGIIVKHRVIDDSKMHLEYTRDQIEANEINDRDNNFDQLAIAGKANGSLSSSLIDENDGHQQGSSLSLPSSSASMKTMMPKISQHPSNDEKPKSRPPRAISPRLYDDMDGIEYSEGDLTNGSSDFPFIEMKPISKNNQVQDESS